MFRSIPLILALLAACSRSGPVLDVSDAWVRATPPGVAMTAGYMVLRNRTGRPVVIESVSTSASNHAEIHHTGSSDEMTSMRHAGAVELPPGDTLTLRPAGTHLMIMGVEQPLREGDTIAIVVQFADGTQQHIDVPVQRNAPDR